MKTIDFSQHNKAKEVNQLLCDDWAHVHVTERTLTMGGMTYNLATNLAIKLGVPKNYFGKESSRQVDWDAEDQSNDDESSDESEDEDDPRGEQWAISSVQGMSMTTNMVLVGQK